jgi:hypothetical protein
MDLATIHRRITPVRMPTKAIRTRPQREGAHLLAHGFQVRREVF